MEANGDARDNFLRALSNYSECLKPYLRVAQDRYVGGYYTLESQSFDFGTYCTHEKKYAVELADKYKTVMDL